LGWGHKKKKTQEKATSGEIRNIRMGVLLKGVVFLTNKKPDVNGKGWRRGSRDKTRWATKFWKSTWCIMPKKRIGSSTLRGSRKGGRKPFFWCWAVGAHFLKKKKPEGGGEKVLEGLKS